MPITFEFCALWAKQQLQTFLKKTNTKTHTQLFNRKISEDQMIYLHGLPSPCCSSAVFQAHVLSEKKVFNVGEEPLSSNTHMENKTRNKNPPQKKPQKNPIWKEFN